jgi:ParB-like chromosome segregation protein Spo0J
VQNTKTEYGSYQRMPVVLPEMEELLPSLSAEQFSALESDILENGCYAPVIVNEDMVIIDGHNRFRICEKHGLPFRMLVFSFADLLEAKQWALDTQKGRRNLEKWELGKIALKLKPEIEARAKANMSAGGGNQKSEGAKSGLATLPNPISAVDTRKELADAVGLGERTMGKVMQIDEHAPAAVKEALDSGDLSINQDYNITRQVQELPEEQRDEAAAMAVELEKAKKEIRQIDAEADRRGRISGLFCKAFERAVALTPTAENVHIWVECTRMRPDEIEYSVQESYELAQVFQKIGDLLKEEITPREPQADEL